MSDLIEFPNDILFQKSLEVVTFDADLISLLDKMETVLKAERGLGLSAVQVGSLQRVIIVKNEDEYIKMVNPIVLVGESSKETYIRESCLSFKGISLAVHRKEDCVVNFHTPEGEPKMLALEGLIARVVQHELDHLNGITLYSRMSSMKRTEALKKMGSYKRKNS